MDPEKRSGDKSKCSNSQREVSVSRGGIELGEGGVVSVMAKQAVHFDKVNRILWGKCEDRGKR